MDAARALERLGGVADLATLLHLTTRATVRRARREGRIVRDARGRYALPTAEEGLRAANRLTGVVSHLSAAAYWGWPLKNQPAAPCVTVPRNRSVPAQRRQGVDLHWAALTADEVVDGRVTSRRRTLTDCIRSLPFDEALAVADSALRCGDVSPGELRAWAAAVTGKGSRQARRVAAHASAEAANPFESVLRAIAVDVPGLDLEPQVRLLVGGRKRRPDLYDRRLRLVVEAESFAWHGERRQLDHDCARYNAMVLSGLMVLRFSWEQVMRRPQYVATCLRAAALTRKQPPRRADGARPARKSA